MTTTPSLSRRGQAYVAGVVAAGAGICLYSIAQVLDGSAGYYWLALAALAFFSGPFSIKVPSSHTSISVSETFVIATALLFGAAPAAIVAAIDGLLVSVFMRNRTPARVAFSMAEPAISIWLAGTLFYLTAGIPPLVEQGTTLGAVLLPLLALVTTYVSLNGILATLAVFSETGVSPVTLLRSYLPQISVNYVVSLCLAALVIVNAQRISFAAVGVIIPILLMSYVTSRTSIARVEDANRHLADLNKLYLSTVETLAMAVDAKDQVTHGHIRRVQQRTVQLARALGVEDELEINALEAAALLHDLGKLAVPEHILNKPGKLTAAEYEQMQRHAGIGADILATVDFPYPVVPVVRHHHENWDGTGYPDGLAGEAIPLGARILSVVDCYDALTSDRPYRRRLSDEEALAILLERRGNMYDPAVVDAFVRTHDELRRTQADSAKQSSITEILTKAEIAQAAPVEARPDTPATEAEAAEVAGLRPWIENVAPDAVGVFYAYDEATDTLEAAWVSDSTYEVVRGVRIPLGERLAGWVGANRRTIVNSDPALDLGDAAALGPAALQSNLSVALTRGQALVGVLSLYGAGQQSFTTHQARLLELVASRVVAPEPPAATPARPEPRRPRSAAASRRARPKYRSGQCERSTSDSNRHRRLESAS